MFSGKITDLNHLVQGPGVKTKLFQSPGGTVWLAIGDVLMTSGDLGATWSFDEGPPRAATVPAEDSSTEQVRFLVGDLTLSNDGQHRVAVSRYGLHVVRWNAISEEWEWVYGGANPFAKKAGEDADLKLGDGTTLPRPSQRLRAVSMSEDFKTGVAVGSQGSSGVMLTLGLRERSADDDRNAADGVGEPQAASHGVETVTWQQHFPMQRLPPLHGVSVSTDGRHAIAVGDNSTVYRYVREDESWVASKIPGAPSRLRHIVLDKDGQRGYVLGEAKSGTSFVYYTSDGGQSWSQSRWAREYDIRDIILAGEAPTVSPLAALTVSAPCWA